MPNNNPQDTTDPNFGAESTGIPMPASSQPASAQPQGPAAEQPMQPQAPAAPQPITPANPPVQPPMQPASPQAPVQQTAQPQQTAQVQQPVQPQVVRPQTLAQQTAPQAQTRPAAVMPGQAPRPGAVQGPAVPPGKRLLTKDEIMMREAQRNKKILWGCLGSFGCASIILIILIFFFVGQAGTESSYLAKALNVNQQQLISSLILIVNLFFGIGALFTFIFSIVGVFKAMMARRDDSITRKKGYVQAAGSFGMLILIIVLWISAWYYLNNQKLPVETSTTSGIVTVPASTINLTAPIEITFDASKLAYDSRKFDIIMYNWNFGDGTIGPGTNIETHTYSKKGTGRYDVTLTLTFKNKETGEESQETLPHTVTIADEKVIALIKADTFAGQAPLKITFDGSGSMDPDGQISEYAWEVDGSGFVAGDAMFERTFEQVGSYTVRLRVTNNKGDFSIDEKKVEVTAGIVPVAVIEILNENGGKYFVNKTYNFDAAKSSSPAGNISKYDWDFGDGTQKGKTRTVQHSFSQEGTYKVVLTVTDEANTTAEATIILKVEAAPQSPDAVMKTVPAKADEKDNFIEGTAPFEVAFDATASTDPDDNIVDYKWDFDGDGTFDAAGETAKWTFKDVGIYTVTLNVIDSTGFEGKAVLLVRVMSVGLVPSLKAEPVSGVIPLTVIFDATGSTYSDGQIVSYEWDFGDGTPPRSDVGTVTYKYSKIGNFTAKVKVRTNDNKEGTATMLISVRQVPLKSCFEASSLVGPAPLTVTFNPQCATGTIATYKWTFGDGENSTDRRPNHVFANPGTYEVSLEVADALNVVDTSSQFITVQGELTPQ